MKCRTAPSRFSARMASRKPSSATRETRGLDVLDATCPLVTKVHVQGRQYVARGPHADPDRSRGPSGSRRHDRADSRQGRCWCKARPKSRTLDLPLDTPLAYVTQTTLSVDDTRGIIDALLRRFTDIVGPDTRDICYATQNRQAAVRELSTAGRRAAGGRRDQQFELEPSARDR